MPAFFDGRYTRLDDIVINGVAEILANETVEDAKHHNGGHNDQTLCELRVVGNSKAKINGVANEHDK